MAPLTRSRARQPGNVPTLLNACYYAQRASAALIISEATQVSMRAGDARIHSREQVEGWRPRTEANDAGGRIFLQRACRAHLTSVIATDNMPPVAPSATTPAGNVH
jgi:N-ethylmaleimide reductase